jgi:putative tryptophan/tyrosine transport system substrate-binding protein
MNMAGALASSTGSFVRACRRWLGGHPAWAGSALALVIGLAAVPLSVDAQARTGVPRIGILSFDAAPPSAGADLSQGWRRGLAEHGYVEGQNILIEWRYAAGRPERLAPLAAELVQLQVDVILALGPGPREAARQATRTIPIVTTSGADPVAEGWAQTLARPGGNVTGLTVTFGELAGKRLELLKQAYPDVVRIAVLLDPSEAGGARGVAALVQDMQAQIQPLGLQIQLIEVRGPNDFAAAFKLARQSRAQVLYAVATNTVVTHRARLAALAVSDKLLSISEFPWMAQAGFLMTYGADIDDLGRRAITLMDKILKGERPGELPIERPTKLQLIVNLKTASSLGITVPPSLLLRADEVIR